MDMVREFPASARPFTGGPLGLALAAAAIVVGLLSTDPEHQMKGHLTAAVLALVAAYLVITKPFRRPAVRISGNRIEALSPISGVNVVEDLREFSLVLSTGWIAFRKQGQQDIMVDEHRFEASVWTDLLSELKRLPFKSVV